ncbi:hypothetical protein PUNSTDRAFT_119206 [Punctularia strigosozonata HHB-11173 SS5]|uniref:uncharacterized protein n=1 Tax=Punctularia strigosozonata (strain HHB-11173) TaxID=741275 RepID=UPI00044168B3|nr:uncharacterized protein PUNSTDRAFT_119206 [Punctularia strigosozonata HHB-11173 SS5]EIN12070.1 hypothetical protein PUNSTDRAFT_119206 [Punctularia strigosozonata HHB-11173 SS5]
MEGYTVGRVIISLVFIGSTLFATFYNINPFIKGTRFGYVAIAQLPLAFSLVMKNNPVAWLAGVGYEKLNYLHRVVGIAIAISSNFHGFAYIFKYSKNGDLTTKFKQAENIWGLAAMMVLDVLLIMLSFPVLRRRWYRVFYVSHVFGAIMFVVTTYYHEARTAQYAFGTAMLYAADRALRLIRSRIVTGTLSPIPELGMTRITVPYNAGWRPGQHVRIRILSSGMGLLRWSESHPFTISTAPLTEENLVLMCKATGGWTTNLYNLACGKRDNEEPTASRTVHVWIEGPYGGTNHTLFNSFSATVLIAGGSGIAFVIAAAQDILRNAAEGQSHLKNVRIVWSVRDTGSLKALMPTLSSLLEAWPSSVSLEISVHYTRALGKLDDMSTCLPCGLSLQPGRPRTAAILTSLMDRMTSGKQGAETKALSGVIVGVCGPASLGEVVRNSIGTLDATAMKSVGGVEIHEEVFGW